MFRTFSSRVATLPDLLTCVCVVGSPPMSLSATHDIDVMIRQQQHFAAKFGDTLPSESCPAGDVARLSESQRGADPFSFSGNKPLRRAQIFDKGVDASMMQVFCTALFETFGR